MSKRIAIAVIVTLLLVAGGWLLQSKILGGAGAVATPPPPSPTPSASPSPSAVSDPASARIIARGVEGLVEKRTAIGGDAWVPVAGGDELAQDDRLRTGAGGQAILEVGDSATVTVAEGSQVAVAEISRETSRVRLEGGRLRAKVKGGTEGSALTVEFKDTDTKVEATAGADFSAGTAGNGQVSVAATEGRIMLIARAGKERVELGAGELATSKPGVAVEKGRIPTALLLKVGKAPPRATRTRETLVAGQATPGSIVSVNGVKTVVGADGKFSTKVPLSEGKNKLVVSASDLAGRSQRVSLGDVLVDTRAVDVTGRTKW